MRTYEELLAAQTTLAHFNKYHDPNTGQFTSKNGGGGTHHPIKDKPGSLEDARAKGAIGPKPAIDPHGNQPSATLTAVKTRPADGKSQKEINKFNNKAMNLVDKISDRAKQASGLYSTSMQMAIKGVQGDRASKRTAGLAYEAAMKNRKLMNKYVDKLENMGVKFKSDEVDYANFQHIAAGEGFIKRALASRFADYVIPFRGYLNPSSYKIKEDFVKQFV